MSTEREKIWIFCWYYFLLQRIFPQVPVSLFCTKSPSQSQKNSKKITRKITQLFWAYIVKRGPWGPKNLRFITDINKTFICYIKLSCGKVVFLNHNLKRIHPIMNSLYITSIIFFLFSLLPHLTFSYLFNGKFLIFY